jgi:hypothetical protein
MQDLIIYPRKKLHSFDENDVDFFTQKKSGAGQT